MKLLDYADYNPLTDPALFPTAEVPTVKVPRVIVLAVALEGPDADNFERIMSSNRETDAECIRRLLLFYLTHNQEKHAEIVYVLERQGAR